MHNRTFNVDRHNRLKFDMESKGSERTRITRPLASGDEISYMQHVNNQGLIQNNDAASSKHSRHGVLIPGMTSNFGGGAESLNSTIQVSQSLHSKRNTNNNGIAD